MNESLSLGLLCFNDEATIGSLAESLDEAGRQSGRKYEILVVDDGSRDASPEILAKLREKISVLRVIVHEKNKGYGGALQSLFEHAANDLIFYTDGDGQYDVREVLRLLPLMKNGVDWVNGYKIVRRDPFYRIWIGAAYQRLMRAIFRFKLRDLTCDFRLIRKTALRGFTLQASSGAVCLELAVKLERSGRQAVDCPVAHYPRLHGRSQYFQPRRMGQTFREILELHQFLKGHP